MSNRSRTVSSACLRAFARAAVGEHELDRAGNRRASGYQVSKSRPFSLNTLDADVVEDEAEVVLNECEQHVRKHRPRLLAQLPQIDFVQGNVPQLVQEHQMSEEVALERRQVQRG